jgi:hypothetical protein
VPFDVVEDFAPVAQVATTPLLLFAHPSMPVADVKELIAYARANPGKLSVGTPGVGSPHHLAAAMLNSAPRSTYPVPYRARRPRSTICSADRFVGLGDANAVIQFVGTTGKALATTSASSPFSAGADHRGERAPRFDVGVWFAIAARPDAPRHRRASRQEIGEITRLQTCRSVCRRLVTISFRRH